MIRRKSSIIIICILATAFAAAVYLLFFKGQKVSQSSEGLSRFKVETIRLEHGWGYVVRQDMTPVIEQKVIPGVPGVDGFATELDARKTGELVRQKLGRGIFPPTISTRELDSLGVKYN
ncbi:hypothetical protein GCM10010967_17950 [Dyadobacter beijingensis]|uniref:DUF4907 domain-containing protein n=1 Tax=Dyadobacter beijingensis TaxID=365489 RepID=A0ABQ2HMD7_9BACT|nr:DUF4907 domain-containing protein [Dyadobacter beijingensis]GGM86154.1 hypothetical protein GCM10010967_17950 [Dyadobacter beijingensis]